MQPAAQIIAEKFQRAVLLHQQGRVQDAEALYVQVFEADSQHVAALYLAGFIALQTGRAARAVELFERSLAIKDDQPAAHANLGAALLELKRPKEALPSLERALQLRPDYPEALNNRGSALTDLGRAAEALKSLERALHLKPGFAHAFYNRGNAFASLQRRREALDSYDRALAIEPGFLDALANRGSVLLAMQRRDDALASFDRALSLRPDHVQTLNNRSYTLMAMKRHEEAAGCFAKLLEKAPDHEYARGALFFARINSCDWRGYQETVDRLTESVRAGLPGVDPFAILAFSTAPDINLRCAQHYAEHKYPDCGTAPPVAAGEGRRIRVAYVSPDLREHVVSHLLTPLWELHDRNTFEVIAISLRQADQNAPFVSRIRKAFDHFCDASSMTDEQAAALIREMRVDIAVDLAGFTGQTGLGILARRPAPVQVAYLGYPASTGAPYIDYLLADRIVIPAELRDCYAERIVQLPDCFQANHLEGADPAARPTRAECGLPEQGFVFCCFNNSFKITPQVFEVWIRLLHKVSGGVLWLAASSEVVKRNLQAAARDRGVGPERLIFAEFKPRMEDHLARYSLADLFLDTFPFGAHATGGDALRCGLPVLTCAGKSFASRVAASLLQAVDLAELVTASLEEYESKAFELAMAPHRLAELREKLMRNRRESPLFDTERFCRHLEVAYVTMLERHRAGESPVSFVVSPLA